MKNIFILLQMSILLISTSCKNESEQDKSKRNDQWVWWVDDAVGHGQWIRVGNHNLVKNGRYTRFYFNGNVWETGVLKDGEFVDTTFFYDLKGLGNAYKDNSQKEKRLYFYKDGNYTLYRDNGKISAVGIVENHKTGDQWTQYYANGKMKDRVDLKNGVGIITRYFENGRKQSEEYVGGRDIEGLMINEWNEDGRVAYAGSILNGKWDGVQKRFYANGQLKKEWNMKAGLQHGILTEYYENGQMKQREQYVDDKSQGPVIAWYANGKVKAVGNLKKGEFDGLQKYFYENGKLRLEGWMKAGKPDGEVRNYDSAGKFRNGNIQQRSENQ